MTRLHESIETALLIEAAFSYLANFANSQEWDPGVASAERLDSGPVGVGSRFRVNVRIGGRTAPMEYRISEHDAPRRVVFIGSGSGVSAVDSIGFEPTSSGTRVDYTADIKLAGLMRLVQPFLGRTFAKIARDAADGMQHQLDARAARHGLDQS